MIVGRAPHRSLIELVKNKSETIKIYPNVDDVLPYYRKAMISVLPLKVGGGTRLRVTETMAVGCPLVATSIAYEGIKAINGIHLLSADNEEDFAKQTVKLLKKKDLRKQIKKNGRKFVEEKYSWHIVINKLEAFYISLV